MAVTSLHSTILRWSDGRVRVVVQCQRCAGGGGASPAGGGFRSCVGGKAEESAQSKTHKITIRTGSALRSDQVACASVTIILKEMDRNIKMFIYF